ncbi:2-oxoacid:acceptor oxidoreductase subunit alpha [Thermoanaerobacterium butyriciformans]|uniref:2-oxoglutarate ferredoxin oxidoreductase subunit alpha n=1 Tax=Thermoanaerobacterium butyriciformans TaxID=1702242 RepID=A0ABS4NDC4_9THEO|nr:2-oxoacid:acceptor oxidoreductase subunit alpha [Thermoanaerobacterium butyriciformans]MBP2071641.1 2-oxoglutarate ferredoxin oxidoreductase subunit alpha [Thermoanaerobacterium butyriciformans]
MDYNILIGGAAGQGIDTISHIFEKTLKRCGFYVFSMKDYMSRVRGGHNFIQVRFSHNPIYSHDEYFDAIVALDFETINLHAKVLKTAGKLICDKSLSDDDRYISFDFKEIAKKCSNPRVAGTTAIGVLLKLFGIPLDVSYTVLNDEFKGDVLEANIKAINAGYNLVEPAFAITLPKKNENIYISGNEAIALGAIAAGVKFYSGYPMTPSTSVMTYIAKKSRDAEIVVEQVEDEISAINMALGASYAGLRAMTGSSGGGFALMVEGISLAGITELPIVITEVQRPGPATGFPTRTEQGDLRFIIHAGHGEFPKMVISLRNPEDAFYQTVRAFNIADKYQIPVILVSDQYLADVGTTVKPFDFNKVKIERHISGSEALEDGVYKRYRFTESGVSPRIIPGKIEGVTVLIDSDEHDEFGHITESQEIRIKMVNKRMKKLKLLEEEIQEPLFIGTENPDILITCWGSMYGPVKEAVDMLLKDGMSVGALSFGDIWPFPTKLIKKYGRFAKVIIDVEQNATAQLDSLMRENALVKADEYILKYDSRMMSSKYIYDRVREISKTSSMY